MDAARHVCLCQQRLQTDFAQVRFSTIYQTPAQGFAGEPFLNLAAGFETSLSHTALRTYLRQLEAEHGRQRIGDKFSPRPLDLDLLLYGGLDLQPAFNVPHPDIVQYPFVLYPLAEIAGEMVHPTLHITIAQLANQSKLSRTGWQVIRLDCRQQTCA